MVTTHAMTLDWNLGALADGLRCYRSQEFYMAHEHWGQRLAEVPGTGKNLSDRR